MIMAGEVIPQVASLGLAFNVDFAGNGKVYLVDLFLRYLKIWCLVMASVEG